MLSLSAIAVLIGLFIIAVNAIAVFAPVRFRNAALSFPRSRAPAWVLTAVDLAWVSWIILHANLGRFEWMKPGVYAAGPIGFLLIVFLMDELLAPRALGGLMLLVANPVLNAARWHESDWRLVMVVIAYLWVIAGMALVLTPYRMRQVAMFMTATYLRCRLLGLVRVAVGAFVLALGCVVY